MRIKVDVANCVGHARCAAVAPNVFKLNDDGYNVTADVAVPASLETEALRGARACPERVITILLD